jgi:hypothetical protein
MMHGSCLCGTVRYEIGAPLIEMHHCHCSRCRKAHGAAFATYAQTNAADLRITAGANQVRAFHTPSQARRSFCANCGSNLFFALDAVPDAVWVTVATLDGELTMQPQAHIYVGSKAEWHAILDALPQFAALPPSE